MKPVVRSRARDRAKAGAENKEKRMWLIVLEAMGALVVLVFVVWWTMFSGRRGGELSVEDHDDEPRGGNKKLKG